MNDIYSAGKVSLPEQEIENFEHGLKTTLKTLRLAHGYSQQVIADILVITRSAYTYYETGKTSPSLPQLYKLKLLYDVPWDSFFESFSEKQVINRRPKKRVKMNPEKIGELSSAEKLIIGLLRTSEDIAAKDLIMWIKENSSTKTQ